MQLWLRDVFQKHLKNHTETKILNSITFCAFYAYIAFD